MEVAVLGPVEVWDEDGSRSSVGPPQEQALLVTLALAAPEGVASGRLIDTLWGDEPPATAAVMLKSLVHRLRRRHGAGIIGTVTGGYRLGLRPDRTDVGRCRALAATARQALDAGDARVAAGLLEEAASQFRGDPTSALSGTASGDAAVRLIAELRRSIDELLLDARLARGAGADLLPALEAAVVEEPLEERRWERLMLALHRAGRPAAALGAYQRARKVLVEELGLEPGPGLRELEGRIIEQDPTLLATDPEAPTTPPGLPDEPAHPASATSTLGWVPSESVLVGREDHLRRVESSIDATSEEGRTKLVLLRGDAGMGKTRLAAEACRRADGHGTLVLYGHCEPDDLAPYRPFSTAVAGLINNNGIEVLGGLSGEASALLARIVPTIRDAVRVPDRTSADPDGDQLRAFTELSALLRRLADPAGAILVIDDLHWATSSTLALLRFLVTDAAAAAGPLAIIGTYRPRDVAVDGPLARTLEKLNRDPNTIEVALGRLDRAEVALFLEEVADQVADKPVVERIEEFTGGVPYLLVSTITHLTSSGGVVRRSGRWEMSANALAALPAGVQQLISQRLASLPEDAVALLRCAAVAGQVFSLATVAEVCGTDDRSALEAMESAELAGLVREDGFDRWRWDHELARSIVLGGLSTTRRVQLHWKFARALAVEPRPPHDDIAHHATEGLLAAPVAEVALLLCEAAEDAIDRDALSALHYVTTALEAIDGNDVAVILRSRLMTVRAMAVFEACDDPDAPDVIAAFEDAEEASLASGDPQAIVRAHTLDDRYPGSWQLLQFDERRVAAAHRALDRLPPGAADERAVLLGHLAELYRYNLASTRRARVVAQLDEILAGGQVSSAVRRRLQPMLQVMETITAPEDMPSIGEAHPDQTIVSEPVGELADQGSVVEPWLLLSMAESLKQQPIQVTTGSEEVIRRAMVGIEASDRGDVSVIDECLEWVADTRPGPRTRKMHEQLRRELLAMRSFLTGEDRGGAGAFRLAARDQRTSRPTRIIFDLVAAAADAFVGRHEASEGSVDAALSAAAQLLALDANPANMPAARFAAEVVVQYQRLEFAEHLASVLQRYPGMWCITFAASQGPMDLPLARLLHMLNKDPTAALQRAHDLSVARPAPLWVERCERLAESAGVKLVGG